MTSSPPKGYTVAELEKELGWSQATIRSKIFYKILVAQRYQDGRVLIFEDDNAAIFANRRAYVRGEKPA